MKKTGLITAIIIILIVILIVIYYSTHHTSIRGIGITGPHMTGGDHMMGSQSAGSGNSPTSDSGRNLFNKYCQRCHPNGGNIINTNIPIRGSHLLKDFGTFLDFIRNPGKHRSSQSLMPSFSSTTISDQQAMKLYQFVTTL